MSEIKTRTFVDEDWKARIQREKEEARRKALSGSPSPSPADETPPPSEETASPQEEDVQVNPFLDALVNMLATQAMYCLGFIGAPGQGQAVVNLEQAREFIEMTGMLRDKMQGNLNKAENALLVETLAELQRLFAARVQQAQAQAMQRAGIDLINLRGETP